VSVHQPHCHIKHDVDPNRKAASRHIMTGQPRPIGHLVLPSKVTEDSEKAQNKQGRSEI
jgi:hypothetical protein